MNIYPSMSVSSCDKSQLNSFYVFIFVFSVCPQDRSFIIFLLSHFSSQTTLNKLVWSIPFIRLNWCSLFFFFFFFVSFLSRIVEHRKDKIDTLSSHTYTQTRSLVLDLIRTRRRRRRRNNVQFDDRLSVRCSSSFFFPSPSNVQHRSTNNSSFFFRYSKLMVEILRARTDTAVRLDYFLSICLLPLSLFRIQLTFVLSFSLSPVVCSLYHRAA